MILRSYSRSRSLSILYSLFKLRKSGFPIESKDFLEWTYYKKDEIRHQVVPTWPKCTGSYLLIKLFVKIPRREKSFISKINLASYMCLNSSNLLSTSIFLSLDSLPSTIVDDCDLRDRLDMWRYNQIYTTHDAAPVEASSVGYNLYILQGSGNG